jgi:pyruvate ferredoxin oxidoreductase alpha subunit
MLTRKTEILEGSKAVAHAVRACRPDVISAYPISPQTHIVEDLAAFVASGELKSKYIRADSEFSAASILYGASAAGARTYTASASQGLLLMTEVIFNIATTRLPVVFTTVNRAVSAPITIQPDHQDSMTLRDPGIIQIYVESIQEAYDTHIQAFRIAEDKEILLPVMVCMDGWILSHSFEPVTMVPDEEVIDFVGRYSPVQLLDPIHPLTYGAYADEDRLMEYKYALMLAQQKAKIKINEVAEEFQERFGQYAGGLIDTYRSQDAEVIFVAMGSLVSTIRVAVDEMRAEGWKVGLVKVRSYRPFPSEAILRSCQNAKILAIIDKSVSINVGGILATEVKSAFYHQVERPKIISFLAGLGGKEVNRLSLRQMITQAQQICEQEASPDEPVFVGLNRDLV